MVYVLDQVLALEEELLLRIKQQGLNAKPQILVVRNHMSLCVCVCVCVTMEDY